MSLLEVNDLTVSFPTPDGVVRAVRRVSFAVDRGQTLGIVGESGSGKSVSALAVLGLHRGAQITGSVVFDGRELLTMDEKRLRSVRGAGIAMIFQDPLSSLHPYHRVGWQIAEMIRAHRPVSRRQARARAIELLDLVGIPQPDRRVDDYPHQFSGGMRQRAMIAMALALDPQVLIADEPTTALDATVQAQILDLLTRLQDELGTAMIMVTHDLGVIAEVADEVLVMYAGKAVEYADRRTLFYRPHHPYTIGLLASMPAAGGRDQPLRPIGGQPPSLLHVPDGCAFHPRCPFVMPRCRTIEPPLMRADGAVVHQSACWLPPALLGTADDVRDDRSGYAHTDGGAT